MGLSDQAWGSGSPHIANLRSQVEATGWGSSNNNNNKWGGRFNDSNIITNVAWGASANANPTNFSRSHGCPHAARRRVCKDFLRFRHQKRLWGKFNFRNSLVNSQVCRQGQYRDGPVTQYFLFRFSVSSVSNCFRIACKIAFCITRGRCVLFVTCGVVDCRVIYCV